MPSQALITFFLKKQVVSHEEALYYTKVRPQIYRAIQLMKVVVQFFLNRYDILLDLLLGLSYPEEMRC